jgi:predicted amidophosphoribosyltransferase
MPVSLSCSPSVADPAREHRCPGCGSFRPADKDYCARCFEEIQALWPEVFHVKPKVVILPPEEIEHERALFGYSLDEGKFAVQESELRLRTFPRRKHVQDKH